MTQRETYGYRLIWFQHFHKAGGTSVVRLAEANGERLYPRHANGGPCTSDGRVLALWSFDERELVRFIDSCEAQGVTFVSTEWGLPLMDVLESDPRVTAVTVLRDPLQRFVSNYFFSLYHGRTAARSIEAYVDSRAGDEGAYTMFNYYCRVLSRHGGRPEAVDRNRYEQARRALARFDCRARLEDGLATLGGALGWQGDAHARRTEYGIGKSLKLMVRGRIDLVLRRLAQPKTEPPAAFVERFVRENRWDIRLYEESAAEPQAPAAGSPPSTATPCL